LTLPNTGQYVLQSAFQYDTSRGFQATGTISFGTAPTLGNFSIPTAQPGDTVTLFGSGFNLTTPSANIVKVAGVQATVTGVTATSITFIVPSIQVAVDPYKPLGIPATVTVTAGGTATAPLALNLVQRIVFNTLATNDTVTSGTFITSGDNGLIRVPSGIGYFDLSVNATGITGTGAIQIFVIKPDGTLQQSFNLNLPINGLSTLNALFVSVDLASPGTYVIQTNFITAGAGGTAAGKLQLSVITYSNKVNNAIRILNPNGTSLSVKKALGGKK
jgi:hypothetical protein